MLLNFVINLLVVVQSVHSAVDAGVTVFGTTVATNFNRLEGRGKIRLDTHNGRHIMTTKIKPISASISCPSSHPFACERGEKCTNDMFKPSNNQPGKWLCNAVEVHHMSFSPFFQ